MYPRIHDIPLDLLQERPQPLHLPSQHPREQRHAETLQARHEVILHPQTDILLPPALAPRTQRTHLPPDDHVLEPQLVQPQPVVLGIIPAPTDSTRGLVEQPVPLGQRADGRRVLEEPQGHDGVAELQHAAGREGGEGGREDAARRAEAGQYGAHVDEVELLGEGPGVFCVADLEGDVGRQAEEGWCASAVLVQGLGRKSKREADGQCWLDRGEISSYDMRARVFRCCEDCCSAWLDTYAMAGKGLEVAEPNSIAHMPVPVATSRTFPGFGGTGAT